MQGVCERVASALDCGKPQTVQQVRAALPELTHLQISNALANLRFQGCAENRAGLWFLVKKYVRRKPGRPRGSRTLNTHQRVNTRQLALMKEELKQLRLLLVSAQHVLATLEKKL